MQFAITYLPYVQIVLSVLLVAGILLQQRGAGLGGAFGGNDSATYNTRRGSEKLLFNATIIIALLFVAASVLALITK